MILLSNITYQEPVLAKEKLPEPLDKETLDREPLGKRLAYLQNLYQSLEATAEKTGQRNNRPYWQELEIEVRNALQSASQEGHFKGLLEEEVNNLNSLPTRLCQHYQYLTKEQIVEEINQCPQSELTDYIVTHFRTNFINHLFQQIQKEPISESTKKMLQEYDQAYTLLRNLIGLYNQNFIRQSMKEVGLDSNDNDMMHNGFIHLITNIIPGFDYQKPALLQEPIKFSSFASPCLKRFYLQKIYNGQTPLIRLPVHALEKIRKIAAWEKEQEKEESFPSIEESAQHLNLNPSQIRFLKKCFAYLPHPLSLNQPVKPGKEKRVGDFVPDNHQPHPDQVLEAKLNQEWLDEFKKVLTDKQEVFFERMIEQAQAPDFRNFNLSQIASTLDISRESARQIKKRIKYKLSKHLLMHHPHLTEELSRI